LPATDENSVGGVIRQYYDQQAEREWERLARHRTEFAVTMRALRDHLPPPPAHLLDCGGGPGRYAIELVRAGYTVTLFDLSSENLQLAETKAAEVGVALAGYEQGTATDLSRFPDASFDAVLLMGPLYHLLEEEDRRQALTEAYRVLRPGGPLFAAFISRYAGLRYAAAHEPTWPLDAAGAVGVDSGHRRAAPSGRRWRGLRRPLRPSRRGFATVPASRLRDSDHSGR